MEYTPGPWKYGLEQYMTNPPKPTNYGVFGDKTKFICSIPLDAEANARLIAAAPELLEACKDYLSLLDSDYTGTHGDLTGGKIAEIGNLITKAEGETGGKK